MLSETLQTAINGQIQKELYSSYIYLSMSSYFEAENLPGAAHWMRLQYEEEVVHSLKLFDYLNDRGGRIALQTIDAPPQSWDSPLAVFEAALAHERKVTRSIHDLYGLAVAENDYPTQSMLKWFIDEQVEEEKNAADIVAQLKMIGDSPTGLFIMDQQFAARTNEAESA